MRFRHPPPPTDAIAMAPLIDVVFLLLTFFLVTSVMMSPPKDVSDLSLPAMDETRKVKKEELDFLVVSIDASGRFFLDGLPATRTELRDALATRSLEAPDKRVRLDADRHAPFRAVAEVLDLIKVHRLENFGIKAADPEDKP